MGAASQMPVTIVPSDGGREVEIIRSGKRNNEDIGSRDLGCSIKQWSDAPVRIKGWWI